LIKLGHYQIQQLDLIAQLEFNSGIPNRTLGGDMRRLCFAFVCLFSICLAVPATAQTFDGLTIEIDADEDGENTR